MWWKYLQAEIEAEFMRLARGRSGVLTTLSVVDPHTIGARRTIPGAWFITPHAVDRYRARVRRCSRSQALTDLIVASRTAHYVKETHGCELWRTGKPLRLRLVVGPGEGDMPALLTVLPGHDMGERGCLTK